MVKSVLLFLASVQVFLPISCGGNKEPPKWNGPYRVKGTLYVPEDNIKEPFEVWFHSENKWRIDYYNGTDQLYFDKSKGHPVKSVPITTAHKKNQRTCLVLKGKNKLVYKDGLLSDMKYYKFVGEEIVEGVLAEKWQIKAVSLSLEETMWVYNRPDVSDAAKQVAVPVKFSSSKVTGAFYIIYKDYEAVETDPIVFKPDCKNTQDINMLNPTSDESTQSDKISNLDGEFNNFVNKYDKTYTTAEETEYRKHIFKHNLRYINSANREDRGYKLAVNHLADRTEAELKGMLGLRHANVTNIGQPFPYSDIDVSQLPKQFDWRQQGAVTPVQDQFHCGSCYSFSAIGVIEGAYFLKHNQLKNFSKQIVMDCSWDFRNRGCFGGLPSLTYNWILHNGGIPTEEDYPYLSNEGYCRAENASKVGVITGYVNVTPNDPNALKYAILKHGPVSVAMDFNSTSYYFYSSGVFYDPSCSNSVANLNHGVLVVGYGSTNGTDYWIVKNSWSTRWGMDGYFLMAAKGNHCGALLIPTYVTM